MADGVLEHLLDELADRIAERLAERVARPSSRSEADAPAPHLLTVREAAQVLRVSVSTVYKRVETKRLPHVRDGARILFRLVDLNSYVESNAAKVPSLTRERIAELANAARRV